MKGLLTAGGHGTRLRPITHTKNKHLIPIANRPMLAYAIDYMSEADITDIGIIINSGDTEIEDCFGSGKEFGVNLTYIEQDSPRGLAHVVKIAEEFISQENFLFYLGDNILVGGIKKFVKEFTNTDSNCHLVLSKVPDPERFGVPEIEKKKIISIEEKPSKPKSNFAVTGIYLYDASVFEAVKQIKPSARGELEISDVHQLLIDNGSSISFSEITGWWKDTGKPSDLLEANKLVLNNIDGENLAEVDGHSSVLGAFVASNGSTIKNSQIHGPVIIGQNVKIENSYIGPHTSISDNCLIIGSEIEYSIIMSGSTISNVDSRIEASLLGNDVKLNQSKNRPRAHQIMIGDEGRVDFA
ncbi:MAG: glucose-1-phosphate thymidylyltransferase [Candidatus Marinimicrobia bacterium]|nr:glucose-1-phosphate thymidylyltransferase [Candidatus Neomarinimicrobiota bacterium]|tara:strand:- start:1410 stop:2474 length:1065 start_codon:yes stop_codon:yes gene_type:complete